MDGENEAVVRSDAYVALSVALVNGKCWPVLVKPECTRGWEVVRA